MKYEDAASCDLPSGIYIWHQSPFLLHLDCVHAYRLMNALGYFTPLLDDIICMTVIGITYTLGGGCPTILGRSFHFLWRMLGFLMMWNSCWVDMAHYWWDISPFGDDMSLGWWNVAPFGGNTSLLSTYILFLCETSTLGDHMWLGACIYGGYLLLWAHLIHLGHLYILGNIMDILCIMTLSLGLVRDKCIILFFRAVAKKKLLF